MSRISKQCRLICQQTPRGDYARHMTMLPATAKLKNHARYPLKTSLRPRLVDGNTNKSSKQGFLQLEEAKSLETVAGPEYGPQYSAQMQRLLSTQEQQKRRRPHPKTHSIWKRGPKRPESFDTKRKNKALQQTNRRPLRSLSLAIPNAVTAHFKYYRNRTRGSKNCHNTNLQLQGHTYTEAAESPESRKIKYLADPGSDAADGSIAGDRH